MLHLKLAFCINSTTLYPVSRTFSRALGSQTKDPNYSEQPYLHSYVASNYPYTYPVNKKE
jgi:hypothetical protein